MPLRVGFNFATAPSKLLYKERKVRHLILALFFASSPVSAFVIDSYGTMGMTWQNSVPGESRTISRSLDYVLSTYQPIGSEEISSYFADPSAYRIEVLALEIMFMDSAVGPAFEAAVTFPTGYSFLQTKEFDGRYSGYSGVTPVSDQGTLRKIGDDRAMTYQITHLSGDMNWVVGIEHNITLEVTKVHEPSGFLLACFALLVVAIRHFKKID